MIYWLWLTQINGIGTITQHKLLEYFGNPKKIYEADRDELFSIQKINKNQIEKILSQKSLETSNNIIDDCYKKNISIMTYHDELYPIRAKTGNDAPILLYYAGNKVPMEKTAAVVGARQCIQELKWLAAQKTQEYVEKGYTIISGMAKGVDSYAHTMCLKSKGSTVAVLGNGVDICYPKEHQSLMQSIIENGMIISEYPPGTKPNKYQFPRRNRIISAWSDEILVLGAKRNSGTKSTVEYAKAYERKILYLP